MSPSPARAIRSVRPEVQFATLDQQTATAELGMWVFIATEVLFFGALFFAYFVYRTSYWEAFRQAGQDSKILNGSINQALLLTSSLTMVAAINFSKNGRSRLAVRLLLATALLGIAFLGVKGWEYALDIADHTVPRFDFVLKPGHLPATELFWVFYWVATPIHAIHLTIGIVLVLLLAWKAHRGAYSPNYYSPLEVVGLYWSFVDVVWVFLFAAIYPLGRAAT